ncbi:MAG: HNH endonuclease [Sphingobacteriales bacterium]|nr:HNH endonuclease [Sphingobacteriales bacterium]
MYRRNSPFKTLPGEQWKELKMFEPGALRLNYALSNFGRMVSYTDNFEEGSLLKGRKLAGYLTFSCRPNGLNKSYLIHKLVAEYFLPKEREDQNYVIHVDYNKMNNNVNNLRWVNRAEVSLHQENNPNIIAMREKRRLEPTYKGHKLTATKVKMIKKLIFDPNRKTRMRIIAKQFGITEMQLYRIKSGENWGHVKLDD